MPESFLNALLPFKFGSLSTPPPPAPFLSHYTYVSSLCFLLFPIWSNLSHFSLIHYLRYTLLHSFIHSRPNEHCHTFNSTLMCPISYSFVFSLPLISHTFESFLSPCVYSSLIHLSLSLSLPLKAHVSQSLSFPLHLLSLIPLTSTLSHIHAEDRFLT